MSLAKEVQGGDRHSAKIKSLKIGLINGAAIRLAAGEIDAAVHALIVEVIEESETVDFAPLLYVIDFRAVQNRLRPVKPSDRAHPLSDEYKLERLKSDEFDILDITAI
jgi:hypothetical protein